MGDTIREVHSSIENPLEEARLREYLSRHYRGFLSVDDAITALRNRSQDKVSVPTEFLLTILKRDIEELDRKAIFIDGLPRNLDQISYSLYFRDLINFRDDPDFFVLIDTPAAIIEARIKERRVCPICKSSKHLSFNPTKFTEYDKSTEQVVSLCDNSSCEGYGRSVLVQKEGDAAGVASIQARLDADGELMEKALELQGIPMVLVRSSIPVTQANDYLEDYEIQPVIEYKYDGNAVSTREVPWVFKDDSGVESYTMRAATFVVNMFSQIHAILLG